MILLSEIGKKILFWPIQRSATTSKLKKQGTRLRRRVLHAQNQRAGATTGKRRQAAALQTLHGRAYYNEAALATNQQMAVGVANLGDTETVAFA